MTDDDGNVLRQKNLSDLAFMEGKRMMLAGVRWNLVLLTYLYLILFAHYCCCIICYCTIYSMENYVEVNEVTWFKA